MKRGIIINRVRLIAIGILLCTLVSMEPFSVLANVTQTNDIILDEYQYHSTLYYDPTNPYNDVYNNEEYAYECYISSTISSGYGFSPIMFVRNGKIVRDNEINEDLFKIYFAYYGKNVPWFKDLLDNAQDYIEIKRAIKFGNLVEEISSLAAKSLGAIGAVYFGGGTASLSVISGIVAKQTLSELKDHVTHIAQIIADAQLGYFYATVSEMEAAISELNNIKDFISFRNCEKYFNCAEVLVRGRSCVACLTSQITADLEDKDTFLEALASLGLDAASGFVGEFCQCMSYTGKLAAMQEKPDMLAKIVIFAGEIAECDESIGEYQSVIMSFAESDASELFSIVDAYNAGVNTVSLMQQLKAANEVALVEHSDGTESPDDSDNPTGTIPPQEKDFIYTVSNGTVTITDYIGSNTVITVPASIEDYPVTTIGIYAFADCTSLNEVIIPDSVTVVGNWAFSNCTGLTNVTIPNSVKYIGIFAFNNCTSLTNVIVGSGVETIADSVFSNCGSLSSITIPRSVLSIGNYVFSGCNSLKGIWVDANNPRYSSDDQGALYNKKKSKLIRAPGGLNSVIIPSGVTDIGISAFSYSDALSFVDIPKSVTSIGEYAFYNCTKLENAFYRGTRDQWNAVAIAENNNYLENKVCCIGEISFNSASLLLQHNLAINYKVDSELFRNMGYTDPYVVFEMNGVKTKASNYTLSEEKFVFTFCNIAPNQMNDTIRATLYATYEGVEYASITQEYSIAEYCYSMLEKCAADEYAELRTLLVDMLHYGAASQIYTGYRQDALVNESLTEEQLQWGTNTDPTMDTVLNTAYKTVENPRAEWKGAGLHLQKDVSMRLKFTTESIDGLTVRIDSGGNTWSLPSDKFIEEDGVYYVYFSGLNAGQMRENVYMTICADGTPISNTVCYSIESYAYEKQNSTLKGLPDLIKAMMKYGDSAYAYIH